LWVVLSVLWIIAVGTVTWSQFQPKPELISYEDAVRRGPIFSPSEEASPTIDPTLAWMRNGALLGLLPPVLVLVVGSALGWALRGFHT
jgi:hypothetical protein